MAAHQIDFCRGVALVLQGESLKAQSYVTHSHSLGTLREKMVRNFIRHETPERCRVETGFIRNLQSGDVSRQCDLLIHDPTDLPPLYRWEDFVVVDTSSARAVVEIKSFLNQDEFNGLLQIQDSVRGLYSSTTFPVYGYALDGVKFETFFNYVAATVRENRFNADAAYERDVNWPFCVTVQKQRYFGICPSRSSLYLAVDFSKSKTEEMRTDGIETGVFLFFYGSGFVKHSTMLTETAAWKWFNRIEAEPTGKAWIDTTGTIHWDENIPMV
jgi:hypothetical protein